MEEIASVVDSILDESILILPRYYDALKSMSIRGYFHVVAGTEATGTAVSAGAAGELGAVVVVVVVIITCCWDWNYIDNFLWCRL